MDFFKQQDLARRHTRRLVVLFGMALLGVILSVYALLAVSLYGLSSQTESSRNQIDPLPILTDWRILALVGGGTLLVIGGSSIYRISSLNGGGRVVATSLGGRLLSHQTNDPDERRVLNVVEEMAIASGIPVPPVYLLEENGINAFAAGHSSKDSVIGVTRGCINHLNRDELQGVMAHEFSHILNGDMKLNIRLIGFVFGIMAIGFLGWQVFRIAIYSGSSRQSKNNGQLPLIAIGAGLMAIGAVGTFFGNWIKASISRQREFLADASAVQFTRNPDGIGGALKRIGSIPAHGQIENSAASEFSHMYFADGVKGLFSSMFATHPPLEQRIKKVQPNWDGKWLEDKPRSGRKETGSTKPTEKEDRRDRLKQMVTVMTGLEAIGQTTPQHVALAHQLISEIPENVRHAAHDLYGARAVLYSLLLNQQPKIQKQQFTALREHAEPGLAELTEKIASAVIPLDPQHRLPLIDITLGSLKELSPSQYQDFRHNLDRLVKADEKTDLFEWILLRIVDHHLEKPKPVRTKYYGVQQLQQECQTLLSCLAWIGQKDPAKASQAFNAGIKTLGFTSSQFIARERISLTEVGKAMDTLNTLATHKKKKLLESCATTIVDDQEVTYKEAEMIRAISESLGCPMPPLLPGQKLF